jgi:hypothetical protein
MSQAWSLEFHRTKAKTLSRDVSDHIPCIITIQTEVPKPRVFRFENFWLEHPAFQSVFQHAWVLPNSKIDRAMRLTSKLKEARKYLKDWQRNIPRLSATIDNIKLVIQFLDMIEECRDMGIQEWNFRDSSNTFEHPSTERLYQIDNTRGCRNKVFLCKCNY